VGFGNQRAEGFESCARCGAVVSSSVSNEWEDIAPLSLGFIIIAKVKIDLPFSDVLLCDTCKASAIREWMKGYIER